MQAESNKARPAQDSPRWCDFCQRWGDHHYDRCPIELAEGTVIEVLADGWVLLALKDGRRIRFHRESMRWEPAEDVGEAEALTSPHRNGGSDAPRA